MDEIIRADNNKLFPFVSELISAGFQGSSQEVVDREILEYLNKTASERRGTFFDQHLKCTGCRIKSVSILYQLIHCRDCRRLERPDLLEKE